MLVLFHAICFILTELSTPVWQNEVRQITYQVVEAMREAEKISVIKSCYFTISSRRFTSPASVVAQKLIAR